MMPGPWVCIFGRSDCIVTNEREPMAGEPGAGRDWTLCPCPADACRGYAACGIVVDGTLIHDAACPLGGLARAAEPATE